MYELFDNAESVLIGTTASVAIAHALLGIDHSLPFIVLGRARRWSLRRTMMVTVGCGLGHVASSVVVGGIGAVAGVTLDSLAWVESARGEVAASLLIGFGLAYAAWATWGRRRHQRPAEASLTPWALFVIFVLGPCEPLIPLMVVPAMSQSWVVLLAVVGVFAVLTVVTMAATVALGYRSCDVLPGRGLTRYADVAAGVIVAGSGAAVLFLGL